MLDLTLGGYLSCIGKPEHQKKRTHIFYSLLNDIFCQYVLIFLFFIRFLNDNFPEMNVYDFLLHF